MIAYLDCVGGLAGDMLLAALLDAGASEDALRRVPEQLGLRGIEICITQVERHGCGALHVDVRTDEAGPDYRAWRDIRTQLEEAGADPRALAAFRRLADAEARVHRVPADDVHFHELGGVDTLVDVCGVVALLTDLGVDRVACSPLPVGRGTTWAAHGVLPLPSPATLELLRGAPLYGVDADRETVTPTGAALVSTLANEWGPLPPLVLERIGTGAGTWDPPEWPNVVRVLLGQAQRAVPEVVQLETNLDDLNPELVPDAVERCFAAGALDVWTAPVQMKKGRPGIVLAALARPHDEQAVARAMLEETSALGLRVSGMRRVELEREERLVNLDGGTVRIKVGRLGGRIVNVAPEHDDCAALARATGRPVKAVWAAALAAAEPL